MLYDQWLPKGMLGESNVEIFFIVSINEILCGRPFNPIPYEGEGATKCRITKNSRALVTFNII